MLKIKNSAVGIGIFVSACGIDENSILFVRNIESNLIHETGSYIEKIQIKKKFIRKHLKNFNSILNFNVGISVFS